ncbi:alpha/beta hydrolase [Paenibacillus azoreducens]|uniref:Lipase n=1 Tax=Paenibacillus azoreducens TaxID=116718 RepID=A0A919YMF8_9BACL|nr:alpha/beta hydrolase [Paenibacillus azoreducens]GIO50917.1 lipase [Paenibacillus azoreducens]
MKNCKFDFPVLERVYKKTHRDLYLYVFDRDAEAKHRPALLFFNGGSFKKNPITPIQFQHQANYFSGKGIVSICVDYRNGSDNDFTPIQAICDVKSSIRWVKDHYLELGIDPNRIIVCGASAGGYITISAFMFPEIEDEVNATNDYNVSELIIFAAGMDAIDIMTRLYPKLVQMSATISPKHNIKHCLPPTLWMCGTEDELYEQNKDFIKQMQEVGNEIRFLIYENMEHGFFNYGRHENTYFEKTKNDIEEYLKEKNYMETT